MLDVQNAMTATTKEMAQPRWTSDTAFSLYRQPFNDLLFRAHTIHRKHFDPNRVQLSRLLNIKTGGCPEDCGYCSQSSHHAPDDVRLSDIEPQFVCQACGKRGADVRPDFNMRWRCCQRGTVDSRLSRSLTHCEEFT